MGGLSSVRRVQPLDGRRESRMMVAAAHRQHLWTYADLETIPDDGLTYDILGGELVVRNVPDSNHAVVLTELFGFLFAAQTAGCGEVYTSTSAVALDYMLRAEQAIDVSHPDLFFVHQERAESLRGPRGWHGPPDLVVEILSPTTWKEHQPGGRWWDAYARHGVPLYWLADPAGRRLEQYVLESEPFIRGSYGHPMVLRPGDTLTLPFCPTVSVPMEQVFRRVRGSAGR